MSLVSRLQQPRRWLVGHRTLLSSLPSSSSSSSSTTRALFSTTADFCSTRRVLLGTATSWSWTSSTAGGVCASGSYSPCTGTTRTRTPTNTTPRSSSWNQRCFYLSQQNTATPTATAIRFSSTGTATTKKDKDRQQAEPTAQELAETPDTIPEWQNPRHVPNEEVVFLDTTDQADSAAAAPSPLPLPPFETSPDAIVAPPHIEELAQQIVQLNLLELKELVDLIAEAFEFDDEVMAASYMNGAALMGSAGGGANSEAADLPPAKVIFDVKLIGTSSSSALQKFKHKL